jgi:hypothetical protein
MRIVAEKQVFAEKDLAENSCCYLHQLVAFGESGSATFAPTTSSSSTSATASTTDSNMFCQVNHFKNLLYFTL